MGNAVAHLSRSDYADFFDFHADGSLAACRVILSVVSGGAQGWRRGILTKFEL
jgi:hypothetical protein